MGRAAKAAGFDRKPPDLSRPGDERHGPDYVMSPPTQQRRTHVSQGRLDLNQRIEELYEQHDVQFEYTARLNPFLISVESNYKVTMGNIMNSVDAHAEGG